MKILKRLCTPAFLSLLFAFASCSKDELDCIKNNTGTIIVENSRNNGSVQVYFNETGTISVNGSGDLSILPGEKQSIQLPAGQHNVKARLIISSCNGGRCSVSSSGLPEKDVDLNSCQDLNLIY